MFPDRFDVYEHSRRECQGTVFALVRAGGEKKLFLSRPIGGIRGEEIAGGGVLCPLTPENASALSQIFSWLRPRRLGALPGFGFGDRLGLATPGHIRALQGAAIAPVLAQQSVRENERTGRSFAEVLADAVFGAFQMGYEGGFTADADHLKSESDATVAAELGYTLFTCDPSAELIPVQQSSSTELRRRFDALPGSRWSMEHYLRQAKEITGLSPAACSEEALIRLVVKYSRALPFAEKLYRSIIAASDDAVDVEFSVDETDEPTSLLEHYYVVDQLRERGVEISSLAPRFPGVMEKAVDYKGDVEEFRNALRGHVALARRLGGYKIGIHSGSDKFALYPVLAAEAGRAWHVKTAGTSYLEALRVVAEVEPALFRDIARLSWDCFSEERATYHLSANPSKLPPLGDTPDRELPLLLSQHDTRQVLHVGFGVVLNSHLGGELVSMLDRHEERYHGALAAHLGRHLASLEVKSPK